jgi:outer membrane protein W
MKNMKFYAVALLITVLCGANSFAQDMKGDLGISLIGGLSMPTNGKYTSDANSTDVLKLGTQFGLGVNYYLTSSIAVELGFNYGFNYLKDDFKPEGKEPLFNNMVISLSGIYNFHEMMPKSAIAPYVKAGVGLNMWKFKDDGLGGDVVVNAKNEDFKATSFGFNVGAGADYLINKNFSVGVLLEYSMFFPKDEDKFGPDFAEQGFFAPQIKLTYNIPTKCSK